MSTGKKTKRITIVTKVKDIKNSITNYLLILKSLSRIHKVLSDDYKIKLDINGNEIIFKQETLSKMRQSILNMIDNLGSDYEESKSRKPSEKKIPKEGEEPEKLRTGINTPSYVTELDPESNYLYNILDFFDIKNSFLYNKQIISTRNNLRTLVWIYRKSNEDPKTSARDILSSINDNLVIAKIPKITNKIDEFVDNQKELLNKLKEQIKSAVSKVPSVRKSKSDRMKEYIVIEGLLKEMILSAFSDEEKDNLNLITDDNFISTRGGLRKILLLRKMILDTKSKHLLRDIDAELRLHMKQKQNKEDILQFYLEEQSDESRGAIIDFIEEQSKAVDKKIKSMKSKKKK